MLKKLIASLSEVEEKYHALYTKQEDGTYKLDESIIPSNIEDVTGLKNNNVALKTEKIKLQERLDELLQKEKDAEEENLEESKQYEQLLELKTKKFEEDLAAQTSKAKAAVEALKTSMLERTVTEISTTLAGEAAPLIAPHVKARLSVTEVEGQYVVQVSDVNGNASNMTLEQLSEEFTNNKLFSSVIKGRESSGGGSGNGGSGSGEGSETEFAKYFDDKGSDYNVMKQIELEKSNKELHDKLASKYNLNDIYGS